jgi:hypothetical protein
LPLFHASPTIEHEPVVELATHGRPVHEIGHGRELPETVAHAVQLLGVEAQALRQRGRHALGARAQEVGRVRGQHRVARGLLGQRGRQVAQQRRAPLGGQARQLAAGGARGDREVADAGRGGRHTAPMTRLSRVMSAS